ncbi:MAG TPA: ATP-binding protein, partial [Planctomycetaceae bacterium]|nr:ATP-binding protein [Planctomycetaceae bacterium]
IPGGSGMSRISLAFSARKIDVTLRNFDRQVATGGLLFLAISAAGGWLLARQAVRPIAVSIQTAQRLDPADLTERLPRTGVGDELDQLADTINGMLDRLATYHSQIVRFTADASHELRSPLAAMRAAIEVSLHQTRSAAEYREFLESLAEQCDRLTDLSNSLLLLARADAGELQVQTQPVELRKLVSEMVELYQPLGEERGVHVKLPEGVSATVAGDPALLQRLISNLLDNAIKFADRGSAVTVSLLSSDNTTVLRVHNRGPCIGPEQLPHVFERFFQADASRSSGGSGLGLSICKWIAEAHHGQIQIRSDAGGTEVQVVLPMEKRG